MFIPTLGAMIALDLDLPVREVVAGSTLMGAVLAESGTDLVVAGCEVALIRTTRYVYRQANLYGGAAPVPTRATEVVAAQGLRCAGPLAAGGLLSVPFTLTVPGAACGTVAASLIQVHWAVRVRVKLDGAPPEEVTSPIVVLSHAPDLRTVADAPPTAADRGLVALRFASLSTRHLAPGGGVTGMLALDPLRPGAARGLRVDLLLREQVHRGPWIGTDPARNPANESRETDTVVARQLIAHRIEMDPAAPVALPFQLPVPSRLPSPSVSTDQFAVSWILRGVADRPLRPDPYVEVELHAATAPR